MKEGVKGYLQQPLKNQTSLKFYVFVGTSDTVQIHTARGFYRKLLGTSEGRVGTSDPRSELPTHVFSAGRGPFVGQNTSLPMGVRTFDPYCTFQVQCQAVHRLENRMVSFFSRHYSISRPQFRLPLNSTVLPILKFKIEINKTRQCSTCTVPLANLASILALFNFNDFKSCS